jgi:hypothetical protein
MHKGSRWFVAKQIQAPPFGQGVGCNAVCERIYSSQTAIRTLALGNWFVMSVASGGAFSTRFGTLLTVIHLVLAAFIPAHLTDLLTKQQVLMPDLRVPLQ